MTTGDRIKKLRMEKGWSQEELGKKIGVQRAAINKYEKGLVVNLKRDVIAKLADALGTSPTDIMGFDDETQLTLYNAALDMQKNDALADIVLRLRSDDDFFCIVQSLYEKTPEQISALASLFK